jgi:hypothetical protein
MKLRTIVGAVLLTQVVGCASIVNGQNQSVSVETRTEAGPVSGANCKLTNNKGTWFVTSPGSTTVQRSYEDLAVRCEKEAMEPGLASAKSSTKAMAFGNIIFGGVIGAGVDISTGAAYDYPSLISVIMGKSTMIGTQAATPAAAAPASVSSAQPAAATATK